MSEKSVKKQKTSEIVALDADLFEQDAGQGRARNPAIFTTMRRINFLMEQQVFVSYRFLIIGAFLSGALGMMMQTIL